MIHFLHTIKDRNGALFYFGAACLLLALVFILATRFTTTQVYNVNAWYKPFKFALSIAIYAWTMAWFCFYLPGFNLNIFNWSVIILFGFEIIYIAIQAGRGQLSHYNVSTSLFATLYVFMGLAASLVTIYTAYVGILFFSNNFPGLPSYYLWAVRFGIIIFVIFSFEGALMGSRMTHTIGGADGSPGLPIINWSTKFGDLRIAHFIGMHALQVLPLLSFYLLKNTKVTILLSALYLLLAVYTLVQALQGRYVIKAKNIQQNEVFQ
ncbi:hypothetical protein BH20BAC1_BH20BAC1_10070 [soil metagenome]